MLSYRIGAEQRDKRISAADLVAAVRKFGMEDHVLVYGGIELHRGVQKLEPRIKVMPEAGSVDFATRFIDELKPRVIAFDARDFKDAIVGLARQAKAGIYVDRLGSADTPDSWDDAVHRGATGIQTDHPAELVQFLRAKKLHP